MLKLKHLPLLLAVSGALAFATFAEDATNKPAASADPKSDSAPTNATGTNVAKAARPVAQKQTDMASTNAVFGKVSATDEAYKSALDAHALADAVKLADKDGGFKGTVAKIYEPRGLSVVEFDKDYKTALTAIVRANNFDKFPVLTNLIGKDVLITGKFVTYRDTVQIALTSPDQIKVVEAAK